MTLEEAKLNIEISIRSPLFGRKDGRKDCVVSIEAIDTVLKALEDSTPKEKIREKMKELGKDIPMMTPRYFEWDSSEVIKLLEKLLKEE